MSIWTNPDAQTYNPSRPDLNPDLTTFHANFPSAAPTPLISLPDLAKELGLGHVLLKDESNRFGLPSFKIAGASWAIHCAITAATDLPTSSTLAEAGKAARNASISLVTCSEGNWGRACARMAHYLHIPIRCYVSQNMDAATRDKITGEGADVIVVPGGDYDAAVRESTADAARTGDLQVMDNAWPGFERIPRWVVQGYGTIFVEIDAQLKELGLEHRPIALAIASVGVGSWAEAVVDYFKSQRPPALVATVEPETAACLQASLEAGKMVTIETGNSIMCGMNCGTVSSTAWPILSKGVDLSLTITDLESHNAVQEYQSHGINAGPCGAAPLAALRKIVKNGGKILNKDSTVILFSTEGPRLYQTPK